MINVECKLERHRVIIKGDKYLETIRKYYVNCISYNEWYGYKHKRFKKYEEYPTFREFKEECYFAKLEKRKTRLRKVLEKGWAEDRRLETGIFLLVYVHYKRI